MSDTTASARPRRNIVLITTDQERWFKDDPAPLPARARLREMGTTFDRFYGASIACSSARSVLYTGQHVPVTKVIDNVDMPTQPDLDPSLGTIGTRLRSHGYYTAYKGKWHLSRSARRSIDRQMCEDTLEPYGFSDYNTLGDDLGGPYEGFEADDLIAADAIHWMKTTGTRLDRADTPWFLAINFVNPHDIMFCTTDRAFIDAAAGSPRMRLYDGPPASTRYNDHWNLPTPASFFDPLDDPARPVAHVEFELAMRAFVGRAATNVGELDHFQNYYVNCMRDVDAAIATVLDAMAQLGILDDTTIVYSTDHGELAGAHGLFGKGPCSYDENLRLPLIVVDPDIAGGTRSSAIASQIDLAPTILGLAGVDAGDHLRRGLPGIDLSMTLGRDIVGTGPRQRAMFAYSGLGFLDGRWTQEVFAAMTGRGAPPNRPPDYSARGLMRTVITDRYKFSRYFAPGHHHRPTTLEELLSRNTIEVFDLLDDPLERRNLASDRDSDHRPLIEALNAELQTIIDDEIGEDDGAELPPTPGAPWAAAGA